MKSNLINMTIADYCAARERDEVQIDKTYQRNADVWPKAARSYFIETILKGFPIPKLALHQRTDLKSKQTTKFVVDGQQRSSAIMAFYDNDLRLSRTLELSDAAGKKYDDLTDDLQDEFLTYLLYFDQFEGSGQEEVREYFRRVNSFTAPLNAEEKRHAHFQGNMKWFLHSLTQRHGETLVGLGVLPKESVIRMQDTKFLAELVHALLNGVTTTTKNKLDSMYRTYENEEVPEEGAIRRAIDKAIGQVMKWDITETSLVKSYLFYSLILAVVLVQTDWPALQYLKAATSRSKVRTQAERNLIKLAATLDDPEAFEDYSEFTKASDKETNVKSQREARVRWLTKAISSNTI
ncbi:MAG: DUF262 domain-containing protein [Chloroflexi bacterium]|nr:DUF262 domain-containing protein [Chloroflexota bacterium]